MKESLKILYQGGEAEIVVKKSRFIANIAPVHSEEEAAAFIAGIKKKYWDARHSCSAFTIGSSHELTRCSDDGEPAQTAGRPMLDVLLGEDIHDVCAVVTRYFGGVLLGTGGLVRAYSGAVKEGLFACRILEKRQGYEVGLQTDYAGIGKIQYLLAQMKLPVTDTQYGEQVDFSVLVPVSEYQAAEKKLIEGTNGTVKISRGDPVWYGELDGEIVRFS